MTQIFPVDDANGYGVTTDGFSWYNTRPDGAKITHSAFGTREDAETRAIIISGSERGKYLMARNHGHSDFVHGRTYRPSTFRDGGYGYEDGWNTAADAAESR